MEEKTEKGENIKVGEVDFGLNNILEKRDVEKKKTSDAELSGTE